MRGGSTYGVGALRALAMRGDKLRVGRPYQRDGLYIFRLYSDEMMMRTNIEEGWREMTREVRQGVNERNEAIKSSRHGRAEHKQLPPANGDHQGWNEDTGQMRGGGGRKGR